MTSLIEQTMETAKIEVYLITKTNVSGFLVETRTLKNEGIDWVRSGTAILFTVPPPEGAIVEIKYKANITATVDFAVEIPFSQIDGMTREYVDERGGLDNSIDVYEGKTIIFARQEQYPGFLLTSDGWVQNKNAWDDGHGWDDPLGWDNYTVIPGFNENQANSNIENQRAGIWKVTVDSEGLYRLQFQGRLVLGQSILVQNGFKYGGKIVRYGPTIRYDLGETVPSFRIIGAKIQGKETIFDGGATRFVDNINIYQSPDEGDKYLMFPRVTIFG